MRGLDWTPKVPFTNTNIIQVYEAKGVGGIVHKSPRKIVLTHFLSNDFNDHTVFLQVNMQT